MSTRVAVLAGLATVLTAVAVHAQEPAGSALEDGRWLPYVGCWVEEDVSNGPMTCVVPESGGVAFLTVSDGEITDRRTVRGDGAARPMAVAGCTGVETARFSADGHRVFTESELTCSEAERHTRGLMAMVEPERWIDVRALIGPESVAWVKRYAPAPADRVARAGLGSRVAVVSRAAEAAWLAASARIRVDEVIEANVRTDAEAVRAWIVEQGEPLRLDADRLVQLADAGVPPEVIDVAVAVSFPDRFAVERQPRDSGYGDYYPGARLLWSPWGGVYDPFWHRYDRWYGYTGYGYGYNSWGPSVVVVRPAATSSRGGRVVKGRGYVPSNGASSGSATRATVRTSPPSGSRSSVGSSSSSSGSKGKAKRRGGG